ncbi:hypothetical protein L249_3323 [Ophiocordyceps polyrhachis-furcata BCC 54312]|uniref:Heme haloperoxidase family profile domain-containing protein n=1 Tax=Ophiocordyceps polyrhachis-furcata BCC 54312 TaxID=1330021 RepID=A0A367LNJ9_9HYPO|nr:hypothetical protein L249_3323 [Ophiocordyceps polyrhachis-furcata BCC 54312]
MARRRHNTTREHDYIRGRAEDRGPCPALNALANQNYLPRDGRNVTVAQVEAALREALSMTSHLAARTTGQLKAILRPDGTFDLTDLRKHGTIEHDRSFTRLDHRQGGDNYTLQPDMFQALLNDADGGPLTVKTLARTYRRRAEEHKRSGGQPLSLRMRFINLGQSVSFYSVAQIDGKIPREAVDAFYLDERFTDQILEETRPRTLLRMMGNMLKLLFFVYIVRV